MTFEVNAWAGKGEQSEMGGPPSPCRPPCLILRYIMCCLWRALPPPPPRICDPGDRCKASISVPCPCTVTFTGVTPGCRQYLQILPERDNWSGTSSVSSLTVNGALVSTSYFPCVPQLPNTVCLCSSRPRASRTVHVYPQQVCLVTQHCVYLGWLVNSPQARVWWIPPPSLPDTPVA